MKIKRYSSQIKFFFLFFFSLLLCSCSIQYRHKVESPGTKANWKYGMGGFVRYDGYQTADNKPVAGDFEIAVADYAKKNSNVRIRMVGVVHIGDKDYYKTLQKVLDKSDLVLYEGVRRGGNPGDVDRQSKALYGAISEILGLSGQLDVINYNRKHWKQCDMITDPRHNRGGKSVAPKEMKQAMEMVRQLAPLKKEFEDVLPMRTVEDYLKHMYALNLARAKTANFEAMAKSLEQWHQIVKVFRRNYPSNPTLRKLDRQLGKMKVAFKNFARVVITERNKYVMKALIKEIRQGRLHQKIYTISVFYGAGHLDDFHQRLKKLGYFRTKMHWYKAWQIDSRFRRNAPIKTETRVLRKTSNLPSIKKENQKDSREEKKEKEERTLKKDKKDKQGGAKEIPKAVEPKVKPKKKVKKSSFLDKKTVKLLLGTQKGGWKERSKARKELAAKIEKNQQLWKDLLATLNSHEQWQLRLAVAQFLGQYRGKKKREAAQALAGVLRKDRSEKVRKEAAKALGFLRIRDKEILEALYHGLAKEKSHNVRYYASYSFGRLGSASLPYLLKALESSRPRVQSHAMVALSKLGPSAAPALPRVLELLKKDSRLLRSSALKALSGMGPKAAPAVGTIRKLLQEKKIDSSLRYLAYRVLGNIGSRAESAIPELIKGVNDRSRLARKEAVKSLCKIARQPEKVLPVLEKVLQSKKSHRWTRRAVLRGVGNFGAKGAPFVPYLIKLAEKGKKDEKVAAIRALGEIGPAAKGALPVLKKIAQKERGSVAYYARKSISKIED